MFVWERLDDFQLGMYTIMHPLIGVCWVPFWEDYLNKKTSKTKKGTVGPNYNFLMAFFSFILYFQINVYKALPFRFTSRLWGQVNSLDVPHMLRKPIYGLYARLFNCNVSEALVEDLTWYQNLSDFFRRELKPGVRPVEQTRSLVSR